MIAAGIIGFVGNEAVAVFRIKVGREINSAALIADGYHARTDGFTSLAVVLGAIGVWLGYPLADPIVGLLITIAIFGIVWQSSKAVFVRMLDGVDPAITDEIRHAAGHVKGVLSVLDVKARWLGHRLQADIAVRVAPETTVTDADHLADGLKHEMLDHIPALAVATVRVSSKLEADQELHGHHAPDPVRIDRTIAAGEVSIVNTDAGERMQLALSGSVVGLRAIVEIDRPEGIERLPLSPLPDQPMLLRSAQAPAEPHEFDARLILSLGEREQHNDFRMTEPEGHGR